MKYEKDKIISFRVKGNPKRFIGIIGGIVSYDTKENPPVTLQVYALSPDCPRGEGIDIIVSG